MKRREPYPLSMKAIRLIPELLKDNPHTTDIAVRYKDGEYRLFMWSGAHLWSIDIPVYTGLPDSVREDMEKSIGEV